MNKISSLLALVLVMFFSASVIPKVARAALGFSGAASYNAQLTLDRFYREMMEGKLPQYLALRTQIGAPLLGEAFKSGQPQLMSGSEGSAGEGKTHSVAMISGYRFRAGIPLGEQLSRPNEIFTATLQCESVTIQYHAHQRARRTHCEVSGAQASRRN